ncbi:MAG: hypothetical protein ACKVPX_15105 [Myxococcaceae bacterium]
MPPKRTSLGEVLVRSGRVTREQLEAGLRAQAIWGGRLGTNLVEAGVLDLETLGEALAQAFGVPEAKAPYFRRIPPEALAKVPAKMAEKSMAIPLGFVTKPSRMLVVAFADPANPAAVDEVAFAAGMRVYPLVAPELRIVAALEQHYSVPRKTRYLRIVTLKTEPSAPPTSQPTAAPRRKYLDPSESRVAAPKPMGKVDDSEWLSGPESEPWPPISGTQESDVVLELADVLEEGASVRPLPKQAPTVPAPAVSPRPAVSVAEAVARIARADRRDAIGEALVDALRSSFSHGLLLTVREEMALGWQGFAPSVEASLFETLALPLNSASVFKTTYERRVLFRGAPPSEGATLHHRIWKLLKSSAPREVVVAPIVIKDRVVALLYAHLPDGGVIPDPVVADLVLLASSAAAGFVRLIQNAKARLQT